MALYADTEILSALLSHVAGLDLEPALSIAWPNTQFPPSGEALPASYLRVDVVPNRNQNPWLADDDETWHRGLLVLAVSFQEGRGAITPSKVAGAIADHFAMGTQLRRSGLIIEIYEQPSVGGGDWNPDSNRYEMQVTMRWQCFVPFDFPQKGA
ncbi:phage tail terminator-like protein [Pararhizobium mangrovi]|uniref:DUF3168 domain-containing protein n=1 Tax=Pararhizobium mangrovi TaxID=2590452 RepID=A0A506TZ73_9HYPH|nr:phage tail terminator-like protein [Pararhizobium mangrovi]TPW26034.1 hypothetical protein FJU11_16605 [Pararhizobium mangrovi]